MENPFRVFARLTMAFVVLFPLVLSLWQQEFTAVADYASFDALLLTALAAPLFENAFWKPLCLVFPLGLAWGLWRVAHFDPSIHHDAPAVGYLLVALAMTAFTAAIYGLKAGLIRLRRRTNSRS